MSDKTISTAAENIVLNPADSYFSGHFDNHKILPAVAQISLCLKYFSNAIESGKFKVSSARFYKEIIPGKPFSIKCESSKSSKLTFDFFDADDMCSKIVFSIYK